MMHNSGIQSWLASMDLEASDADKLFDMLRGTDPDVDRNHLVSGISALKGTARSLDVHYLMNAMNIGFGGLMKATNAEFEVNEPWRHSPQNHPSTCERASPAAE